MMKYTILVCLFFISGLTVNAQQWHVYVFIAEGCPVCNYMGKPLQDLAEKYSPQVSFHAVFPFKKTTQGTAQIFKEKYGLDAFETILDKGMEVTKKLGASITPEAVVVDESGNVLYRGRINSAYYAPGKMKHSNIQNDLDEALKTLISGLDVPQPWPTPIGCYITLNGSM